MHNNIEKYSNGKKTLYVLYLNLNLYELFISTDIFIFHDPYLNVLLKEYEYDDLFRNNKDYLNRLFCGPSAIMNNPYYDRLCLYNMDKRLIAIMVNSLLEKGYKPTKKLCKKLHLI
jgi:hypothetical protein